MGRFYGLIGSRIDGPFDVLVLSFVCTFIQVEMVSTALFLSRSGGRHVSTIEASLKSPDINVDDLLPRPWA